MQISHYPSQSRTTRTGKHKLELDHRQFATDGKQQRVNDAIAYAKASARACARTIVIHNVPLDALDVSSRMAGYQVNRHLRDHATQLTFEYVKLLRERAK